MSFFNAKKNMMCFSNRKHYHPSESYFPMKWAAPCTHFHYVSTSLFAMHLQIYIYYFSIFFFFLFKPFTYKCWKMIWPLLWKCRALMLMYATLNSNVVLWHSHNTVDFNFADFVCTFGLYSNISTHQVVYLQFYWSNFEKLRRDALVHRHWSPFWNKTKLCSWIERETRVCHYTTSAHFGCGWRVEFSMLFDAMRHTQFWWGTFPKYAIFNTYKGDTESIVHTQTYKCLPMTDARFVVNLTCCIQTNGYISAMAK